MLLWFRLTHQPYTRLEVSSKLSSPYIKNIMALTSMIEDAGGFSALTSKLDC